MSADWKNWCRLCAKSGSHHFDMFLKQEAILELPVLIQKYFLITINPFDETPKLVCKECIEMLTNLEKFAIKCAKVDKMFSELVYDNINNSQSEVLSIRYKYGLDEEEKFIDTNENKSFEFQKDQYTDTEDLASEIVQIKEEEELTAPVTRRKQRSKSKANDVVNAEYVSVKSECKIQESNSDDDILQNMEDEDYNDNASYESDTETNELQDELKMLQDETSSEEPVKKKRSRKEKKQEESITCTICDPEEKFDRARRYQYHMRTKHPTEAMPFVCSKCPKRFATESKVKVHELVHLPKSLKMVHPCPYCDKKFSKAVNVQAHVRAIHIGDRPFICEECGKSFGTKGALKEHQITHSEERPYQCAHCPKKFKNLPRLKTHEDIHTDTIYVCPHCGLQLNTKRTLKMHMVVHSDHKKYKCQYCGNEYKRSKALKNHLILHTGLRPYLCPFCDKTFANGSNCRSHKKKSHPLELAAMEAAGEVQRATNIPKLEHLQPKSEPMPLSMLEKQQTFNMSDIESVCGGPSLTPSVTA